jgi:hypothetical protein
LGRIFTRIKSVSFGSTIFEKSSPSLYFKNTVPVCSTVLEMNRGSVICTKCHKIKIRKSKFGFAKSILSDMIPVGPGWVQVNAELLVKNYQTRINLYSVFCHFCLCPHVPYPKFLTRPSGPAGPSGLGRRTRASALGLAVPLATRGQSKIQTAICSANLPQHPIPLDRASALARLYTDGCLESTSRPLSVNKFKIRKLTTQN